MSDVIHLNLGFTNVYLLKSDSGYVQFDTGYKHNMKKYLKLLEKNQILPEEIKLIIINHAHFDHTGALKETKELTKAQVLVHENEKEFVAKGISAEVRPHTFLTKLLIPTMPKSWARTDPVEPDIVIIDNYSLEDFGIKAKVIHTPGHTPGTISVITEDGDAIVGCNLHGPPLRLRRGFPAIYYDEESIWKSWERIIEEGAKNIYISHGKPFKVDLMKKKLAKRKKAK
ncbi:MAG: putative metallo-hydrolase YflN [Candidatus Heimdallarchaeota archaeon AB_125]|nr:MAG: putative metallo-hydrolase YflN [Candidatus Heimdallarchaeota archaeon AB_125]